MGYGSTQDHLREWTHLVPDSDPTVPDPSSPAQGVILTNFVPVLSGSGPVYEALPQSFAVYASVWCVIKIFFWGGGCSGEGCLKWGGGGSLRDPSGAILKQGVGKGRKCL